MRSTRPVLERWHLIGLFAGLCFVVLLAFERLHPSALRALDTRVADSLFPYASFHWTQFFLVITVLGSPVGIAVVALGTMYFLRKRYHAVLHLFLSLVITASLVGLAKAFVERSRPQPLTWITPLNSYSFPSWHTGLTTVLYGFILITLYRRSRTKTQAFFSVLIPSLVIFLVGFSRIALSEHYVTDVVGGFLLGIFCLTLVYVIPHTRIGSRA